MGTYLASVDRLLAQGHDLFPASGGGLKVDGGGPPSPPPPPPGASSLTDAVTAAADGYQRSRAGLDALDANAQAAADDGVSIGQSGRANAGQVRDTARAQAAAIAPAANNSSAGVRLLNSTMDQRIGDMQRQVDVTHAQNRLLAVRLRQMVSSYQSMVPRGGLGGGGLPFSSGFGGLSSLAGTPASLMSRAGRHGAAPGALVGRSVDGPLPVGTGPEDHLQKNTILAKRAISAAFPQITQIGGYRADALPWHPQGKAIDCMIPNPLSSSGIGLGNAVRDFALKNWERFGLNHVIWQNTIWTSPTHSEPFGSTGSITDQHRDHVHVATNGGGYPSGGETYRI